MKESLLDDDATWRAQITDAFHNRRPPSPFTAIELSRGREIFAFLKPFDPLIAEARERLRKGIERLAAAFTAPPFDPATVDEILFVGLPSRLGQAVSRTMVLELNVARLMDQLQGDTPEERFRCFIDRLSNADSVLELLREYPVLARYLVVTLNQWVDSSLEFLGHLCGDWPDICASFSNQQDPGVLEQLGGGAGDSHRQGRSVRIARFSSGLHLVYKPKSMAVERHFQELLEWINERDVFSASDAQWFRTLSVLDRGTHGWVEFVKAESCDSPEQVSRFYRRQGGYLALLYGLEAVDFHFENLIAAGEHPVLIDLEALFHPRLNSAGDRSAAGLASSKLGNSVMRVGLLPQRVLHSDDSDGCDLAGLSSIEGQLTPFEVPNWEDPATDEMRFTRKKVPLGAGRNRPLLQGKHVKLLDHRDAIVDGFTRMYRLLERNREELLAADSPILRFAGDEVRVILRPTMAYGVLLDESLHPDMLRDETDRDNLFDRLAIASERAPYFRAVVSAEREDLLRGDIPLFRAEPGSRNLWGSTGTPIGEFFDESGLTLVQSRLNTLGDEDLAQQLWFIHASLATQPAPVVQRPRNTYLWREAKRPLDRRRLIDAACSVGNRLEALALRGDDDAIWIGLTAVRDRYASLKPLGLDLYDGLPGVTLFLAHLAAITGVERYQKLADEALVSIQRYADESKPLLSSIGGFAGWGGVIYSLAHLGAVMKRPGLFDEAAQIVSMLPPLIVKDKMLDFIGGAAGCIRGLLALQNCSPSPETLAAAALCGERLLATAQPQASGIGWITPAASRPLTGFSHGAAGYTVALLELAAATGDYRFRSAALASLEYERSQFSPGKQNWLDLRDPIGAGETILAPNALTAWCHGAMGIGLARLHCLRHLDDNAIRQEIDIAIQTTLLDSFGLNHSLCHGDCGSLELLLAASTMSGDTTSRSHLNRLAAVLLEDIENGGWICGHQVSVESPGVMTGLAGIGYQLLRLAEPEKVPSILTLAPPFLDPVTAIVRSEQDACVA
jgi:type 2 lantibiotic biosynthesis protein LanM